MTPVDARRNSPSHGSAREGALIDPVPACIIVGAGPAGCVLATRLTENPVVSVTLIEAGGSDCRLTMAMPAAIPFAYQNKSLSWSEQAGPEPHLAGQMIDEKRGHVLGVASLIKAMICKRGNPLDFHGWAVQGLSRWGWKDMLPYFRKLVSQSPKGQAIHAAVTAGLQRHAHKRGIRCSRPSCARAMRRRIRVRLTMIRVIRKVCTSHNAPSPNAARAYLRPAERRPKLTLRTGAMVTRVLLERDRATGVMLANGTHLEAGREVIVVASTSGAAKLLLLSGIGPADQLNAISVPVALDQRHVGRNLENHPGVNVQFAARRQDMLVARLGPHRQSRRGLRAREFFEAGAIVKTRDAADYANLQLEFPPLARPRPARNGTGFSRLSIVDGPIASEVTQLCALWIGQSGADTRDHFQPPATS